ncbi:MAG TPA: lamin tail domain-containing protein [Candidatus Paceibacterota bacterium]|nr:lamin tail domain-containing protein [Candidatus Paceibacterota bacterium]
MRGVFNNRIDRKRSVSADTAARRLAFLTVAFAAMPLGASAAAMFTEIMYDAPGTDAGREWIEVQNTGESAMDLSTWKLFEANSNHKIAAVSSPSLPAGGFAVIADNPDKFKADYPDFTGLIFDSAFSLSNSGETLVLRDASGADVDSVTYLPAWGAAGDGNSLQRSASGVWVAAPTTLGSPTIAMESSVPAAGPGATSSTTPEDDASPLSATDDPGLGDGTGETSAHSGQEPITSEAAKPEFTVTVGRPRLGFVGAPLLFESKVKASKNLLPGTSVRSIWAMGDGAELFGPVVWHAYQYPGDYVVVANTDFWGQSAVAKTKVRIVEPHIKLSVLPSGAIELSNLDKGELNIGGFIIEDRTRRFVAARDTIILPRSSIRLSPSLTGIDAPQEYLRLADPSGKILSTIGLAPIEPSIALPPGLTSALLKERLIKALNTSHEL